MKLNTDVVIMNKGYLYLPLLYDSDVHDDLKNRPLQTEKKSSLLIESESEQFIKTLNLDSYVKNYEHICPKEYKQIHDKYFGQFEIGDWKNKAVNHRLDELITDVLPQFVQTRVGLKRRKLTKIELVDLITSKCKLSNAYGKKDNDIFKVGLLENSIQELEYTKEKNDVLPEGKIRSAEFQDYMNNEIKNYILRKELSTLKAELKERKILAEKNQLYLTALDYIQQNGIELDGFGIKPYGSEWIVFVNTGEYALKDFDGRIYAFPNASVAVRISNKTINDPRVLNNYKHPFLSAHCSDQKICTGNTCSPTNYSSKNLVTALSIGVNTLLYGYFNKEHFGGYNSLDGKIHHGNGRYIDFENYHVSPNNPKIKSGKINITNSFMRR
ncbi:MAG: hypothetical protein ABIC91_08605 [Nanoarchaeota archaeon]|nr:hypothetical protein [Nanoarchaeota archaeon]MBU1030304.1 hypothetical protein [Nanoarchaeota archaeon]MBU1849317.1 hypothetical protein [Nanoarchaeota archaeon]